MTVYINAIGYRDIAFPIVGVALKFSEVSKREYNVNTITKAQRQKILKESDFDKQAGYLFPDEFTLFTKHRKTSQLLENLALMMSYRCDDDDIFICSDLPGIRGTSLTVSYGSRREINLALWQAESLREPYIKMANEVKPQFEFTSNKGEPTRRHYKSIFKYGLTRYHHSITPYSLAKYVLDLAKKKDEDLRFFFPYFKKPPKWWWEICSENPTSFYTEKELKFIEKVYRDIITTGKREKLIKDKKTFNLLKSPGKSKPIPERFKKWLEDNKPEDFDLPFL